MNLNLNRQRSSVAEITSLLARLAIGLLALPLLGAIVLGFARADESHVLAAPAVDEHGSARNETAVLAGGCFWGMQGVFEHVKGVTKVVAGYSGGDKHAAEYETVSTGTTGHAESVQISFDPRQISYGQLLRLYFSVAHDPTQLNRQGPDGGPQYRSEIFLYQPGAAKDCPRLHRAIGQHPCVFRTDCDPGRTGKGLLPGGGLPSGLSDPPSGKPLHSN